MKILTIDIETRPNLVWTWGLWNQNIAINQIEEAGGPICFAAKWYGQREIFFSRDMNDAWQMLNSADAVVGWNSDRFDVPHLNTVFEREGWGPPSPYAKVDLLKTVRRQFKFPSNKLDYVSQDLLGQKKLPHTGFKLWRDCMLEDEKAWRLMRKYNIQDVKITEKLYARLLPWIPNHPSVGLYDEPESTDLHACRLCTSKNVVRRGYAYTSQSKFQRYFCNSCGVWSRGTKRIASVETRGL